MEEELAAFHARAGVTTFYITHDQREAMALGDRVAVMRDGRFAQVAPPETVYARPADEGVARFVGRAAVLDATVERVEGETAAARIGPLVATVACAPGARPGAARVAVRPEDVRLGADGAPGRVLSAAYRGGFWEGAVAVGGLAEPLPVATPARLAAGEAVAVVLGGGWVLPG
jgi:iron(III) transport system ATP-binding protein